MVQLTSKVSVILPTYNRADLLPKSIRSILDQDFADLELIIVDDGSTDNTATVVQEMIEKDRRIVYAKLPKNRGVYFARDIGWRKARGEYIAWADSDDQWLPGKLGAQVTVLDTHPDIDILFADYRNIDHLKGARTTLFTNSRAAMKTLRSHQIGKELVIIEDGLESALLTAVFVSIPTALFRANLFEKVGSFDIAYRNAGDLEFFWRAALLGACYAYLDRPVMERHKVKSSITTNRIIAWRSVLEVLHRCRFWCDLTNRDDLLSDIRSAQQRAIRNLIWAYGRDRQRNRALGAMWRSLRYGFSGRTLLYGISALLGPNTITSINRLRPAYSSQQDKR